MALLRFFTVMLYLAILSASQEIKRSYLTRLSIRRSGGMSTQLCLFQVTEPRLNAHSRAEALHSPVIHENQPEFGQNQ